MSRDKEYLLAKSAYRNLSILAVLTVVLLGLLAIAPARSYFREWRSVQDAYNRAAARAGKPGVDVAVQQIWRPEIGLTDRCVSCHLGMGQTTPLAEGDPLFFAHPEVHHEVDKMGCTICHRGQGLATSSEAAHGHVKHWEEPMLETSVLEASCGTCHGPSVVVPPLAQAERGAYLFELHGCRSCHVVDGVGGMVGPDLSGVALKGYSREWHTQHLRQPAAAVEGSRMMSFGHLSDDEIDALLAYLETLIGAPRLVRGKAIAMELGCRGCHQIGGRGGDHGPSFAKSASTKAVDRDFSRVPGPRTDENWQRQHLRAPREVTPESKMPAFELTPEDEDALVTFIMSERDLGLPMEQFPKATVINRLGASRDYDRDNGALLYQMYCSACHGPDGTGQDMATLGVHVPAITGRDFLAVASDQFLRMAIRDGRTGRDMPAWASPTGLDDAEIDTLIAWLRSHEPVPPTLDEVRAQLASAGSYENLARRGQALFRADCSGCHGLDGRGTVIAPALSIPEFRAIATDAYIYNTLVNGRANTAMPAHRGYDARELAALIAWVGGAPGAAFDRPVVFGGRELATAAEVDRALSERLMVDTIDSYRATGTPAYGRVLYDGLCQGCHGPGGAGGLAPAIGNRDFLAAASDGFIAGSMLLGRGERAMRSFDMSGISQLEARDIGDVIAYLREAAAAPPDIPGRPRVQGDTVRGAARFAEYCSPCHGPEGKNGVAPSLHNSTFLDAASDGFLQATIARGRRSTAMFGWAPGSFGFAELSPEDINDIVAYIRTWRTSPTGQPGGHR